MGKMETLDKFIKQFWYFQFKNVSIMWRDINGTNWCLFPRCYRPLYLQYISHGAGWDESIIDFCSDILMFKNVSIVWLLQDGTVIFVALFLTFTNACHSVISCGWDKLIIYFCSAICVHHMAWARDKFIFLCSIIMTWSFVIEQYS